LLPSLLAGGTMAFVALGLKTNTIIFARLLLGFFVYGALLLLISRARLLGASRTLRHCLTGI
jgi:hypothetical protein